jgi:hypothetical protein
MEDQLIWIDAISLNQEDNDERSHEVLRMDQICRRARAVIIWFGSTADENDYAMEQIKRFTIEANDLKEAGREANAVPGREDRLWPVVARLLE